MSDPPTADRYPRTGATGQVLDDDLRQELRATLLAARELGPEFEPLAVESFVDRLMPAIERRRRYASRSGQSPRQIRGLVLAGIAMVIFAFASHASHEHRAFGSAFGARHGADHRSLAPYGGAFPPAVPQRPAAPPAPPVAPS